MLRTARLHHQWRKPSSPIAFSYASLSSTPDQKILDFLSTADSNFAADCRSVHARCIIYGFSHASPFAASRFMLFFLRRSQNSNPNAVSLSYLFSIFNSIQNPDAFTWNALLSVLSPADAVKHYCSMRGKSSKPNALTFGFLVKICLPPNTADSFLSRQVHCQIFKSGAEDFIVVKNSLISMYCNLGLLEDAETIFEQKEESDLISWNTMLSGFGKAGKLEKARQLFDQMPSRNLVSWSAMIDGYVRGRDCLEALNVFNKMQREKVKPDAITLASVLKACAQLGDIDKGRQIHFYIDDNGLSRDDNVILATALIDMYMKCGCIDDAKEVFDKVPNGDVILWNAMISGLAVHGYGEVAIELLTKMEERGITPNSTTFLCLLTACVHSGLVNQGKDIFYSMENRGLQPQREHYGCLADLLGRAGKVEDAEQVLFSMPMESQPSQWGALMSACRMHGNVDVGERVGKHLISLEPDHDGRYIMLSNTYIAAGRWDDADTARKLMDDRGIRKVTGASFYSTTDVS